MLGDHFSEDDPFQDKSPDFYHGFEVEILNNGASATEIEIYARSGKNEIKTNHPTKHYLKSDEIVKVSWTDKDNEHYDEVDLGIFCFDSLGRSCHKRFELVLDEKFRYQNLTNPEDKTDIVKTNKH